MYALDKLDNENGFFLMVEASEIDKASHSNQAGTAIRELLELDQTVEMVTQWVGDRDDTLIVVTADHETGALYYNENTATKQNIFDNIKFLSQNHSRTRVTVDVFGKIDEFIEEYNAGIVLTGTEIKSIRAGKASLVDSYCYFHRGELWIKGMNISEYKLGTYYNHEERRERKLLLTHKELVKLERKVKESGLTIIPVRVFLNEKGYAKLRIALARGKKEYDKRESLKLKDAKKDMDRAMKR